MIEEVWTSRENHSMITRKRKKEPVAKHNRIAVKLQRTAMNHNGRAQLSRGREFLLSPTWCRNGNKRIMNEIFRSAMSKGDLCKVMSPPSKERGQEKVVTIPVASNAVTSSQNTDFPNLSAEVDNRFTNALRVITSIGDTNVSAMDEQTIRERSALFQAFYPSLVKPLVQPQPIVKIPGTQMEEWESNESDCSGHEHTPPTRTLPDHLRVELFIPTAREHIIPSERTGKCDKPSSRKQTGQKNGQRSGKKKRKRLTKSAVATGTASFFDTVVSLAEKNPEIWSFFALPVDNGTDWKMFPGAEILTSKKPLQKGDTLLHYVLRKGTGAVRQLLLDRLSSRQVELLDLQNDAGETPLDIIKAANDPMISTLLTLPPRDERRTRWLDKCRREFLALNHSLVVGSRFSSVRALHLNQHREGEKESPRMLKTKAKQIVPFPRNTPRSKESIQPPQCEQQRNLDLLITKDTKTEVQKNLRHQGRKAGRRKKGSTAQNRVKFRLSLLEQLNQTLQETVQVMNSLSIPHPCPHAHGSNKKTPSKSKVHRKKKKKKPPCRSHVADIQEFAATVGNERKLKSAENPVSVKEAVDTWTQWMHKEMKQKLERRPSMD